MSEEKNKQKQTVEQKAALDDLAQAFVEGVMGGMPTPEELEAAEKARRGQ